MRRLKKTAGDAAEETIGAWLRRHGQTVPALERFWAVILQSALSETLDHISIPAARQVFCDGFLASRKASELLLPRMTLGEIFCDRVGRWLAENGVEVHLGTPVRSIEGDSHRVHSLVLADGVQRTFDALILAVSWQDARPLLSAELQAALPELDHLDRIRPAAITAAHLWFDRPVIPCPHAVLIGRLSPWVFTQENYCQVVISASHRLPERSHDEWLAEICRELQSVGVAVENQAGVAVELPPQQLPPRLLHGRIITRPAAVFSMEPGVDRFRPAQRTKIANLALAGDWTATGWPGTMESAVRSGFLAVEALISPLALWERGLSTISPLALWERGRG
jgi:squalene-associated FAD-dependent desaturase